MKIFDKHFSPNEENDQPIQTKADNTEIQTIPTFDIPKDNSSDTIKEKTSTSSSKDIEPIDFTIFTKTDDIIKPVEKVYFKVADKNSKSIFNIDKTAFAPIKLTLLTKPFSNAYYDQLVGEVLMNRKKHEDINIDFIMNALVLYEKIKENNYPIYIKSVKYPKLTHEIVQTLNKVFNEYMPVFDGIYQMFSTKVD